MSATAEARRRTVPRDDAKPFDFRRPTALSRENVRALQIVQESMARGFTTALAALLRAVTRVSIRDIDQCTYDEYLRSVANPTLLTMLSMSQRRESAMLEIPLKIAYTAAELLLGGTGAPQQPRRAMTDLEIVLMGDVVGALVPEIRAALEPVMPQVEPRIVAQESNPQFAQLTGPSDMVVVISLDVKLELVTDVVRFCIPFSDIQSHLEELGEANTPHDAALVEEERVRLQDHLETAPVEASVTFRPVVATSRQLLDLRAGDLIVFDHATSMPLTLEVDGVELLDVVIGRVGRKYAVQVDDLIPEGRRRRPGRLIVADET